MLNSKGFYPFNVLLPQTNLEKWAVIACDQYTSDVSYWNNIAVEVGDMPSALKIIIPEAYLNDSDIEKRIINVNCSMKEYLDKDIFTEYKDAMVYVERQQSNGQVRKGIVGVIDLEDYEFRNGEECLIRPTEDVVFSRIPPRVKVREQALLETSHVLLLVADRENNVIGRLKTVSLEKLYDFNLRPNGGKIKGYLMQGELVESVQMSLKALEKDNLMFLVGDGNHSIATAKEFYEKNKGNDLARYAMVEIINLYDESLSLEPIHRIVYNTHPIELLDALMEYYPGTVKDKAEGHTIDFYCEIGTWTITIPYKYNSLAVGALQQFLDYYQEKTSCTIDYIHDVKDVRRWSLDSGKAGFVLPQIDIDGMFNYVKEKGRLPRKTFSIGNQEDKKYYLECRRISF